MFLMWNGFKCATKVTNCDWGINLIGTASADRTARIWSVDGSLSDVVCSENALMSEIML